MILFAHKGRGLVIARENKYDISEGDLVIVPKGVRRSILAKTDMEILHLVSPPPSEKDHEKSLKVESDLQTAWNPRMMTEEGRKMFKERFGYDILDPLK